MTPSRRSLLRGFLALPVVARFAPAVAAPATSSFFFPAWGGYGPETYGGWMFLNVKHDAGSTSYTYHAEPGWTAAMERLDADPRLDHVDLPDGGVVCRLNGTSDHG